MDKKQLEKLINRSLTTGADFSEIYCENTIRRKIVLSDSKIDSVATNIISGVGIRLAKGKKTAYSSTNDITLNNLEHKVDELKDIFHSKQKYKNVVLKEKNINAKQIDYNNGMSDSDKKEYLSRIDEIARNYSSKIEQVNAIFFEEKKNVEVANYLGEYSKDKRYLFRLVIQIYVKDKEKRNMTYEAYGDNNGYSYLDSFDVEKEVKNLVDIAIEKLSAIPCPTGKMPVVIGPGFGAVIIHEACGHALEATFVAKNVSVLSNMINQKVASDKVTIIDDGSLEKTWGSTYIDDEGNLTQKNILIENGILKKYLIDELNTRLMDGDITGSGRRESYLYAPTSRMNNTYLASGKDKIDDMIKSIDYGVYAKKMDGGSVDPNTGDFNFAVRDAYLIENGKVTKTLEGASLIGNTRDILNKIEMISDDLKINTGYCGSISGYIPVTIGQPTIKVSEILVGGNLDD